MVARLGRRATSSQASSWQVVAVELEWSRAAGRRSMHAGLEPCSRPGLALLPGLVLAWRCAVHRCGAASWSLVLCRELAGGSKRGDLGASSQCRREPVDAVVSWLA